MSNQQSGDELVASEATGDEQQTLPPQTGLQQALSPTGDLETVGFDRSPSDDATLPPKPAATGWSPTNAAETRGFGDYELLGEIARGGMGVVFKARQKSLNRIVALKMILAGQLAGKEDVQRFYAEAEAAAALDHPGIVPIYEVGRHGDQHYFSMAYVDGGSLAALLQDGPLAPKRAAEYVEKVSRAIAFAHEQGVIHRDLKPGNVLLDRHGEPKVTDFGLAKKVQGGSELTSTGQILGTPSYMPPEQAAGKIAEIGPAADVYALGAILYALLAGRPPFQADNPLDTLLQVLEREPVPPRQLNPKLPADLETICLKCLEKAPERRYTSAQAVAEELTRFLSGEPILARPISSLERGWRWCKRKPVISGMSAAIVLVSLMGLAGILWQWRDALIARRDAVHQKQLAEQERDGARLNLYVAQMHLARQAWESSDMTRVQELLRAQEPKGGQRDHRGWEWDYLRSQSRGVVSLEGHTLPIAALAWSPDGKRVASIGSLPFGEAGELRVWDSVTGKELFAPGIRVDYTAAAVAWSPDGQWIAWGGGKVGGFRNSHPGELRIVDAQTGREVRRLQGHMGGVNSVDWSQDARRIASVSGAFGVPGEAKIWDASTGAVLLDLKGHKNQVNAIHWSPDGKRLVTASTSEGAKIWDAEKGKEVRTYRGHPKAVSYARWSPDGKRIASAGAGGQVKVWNPDDGAEVLSLPTAGTAWFSWGSDGDHLSLHMASGTVKTWSVPANKEVQQIDSHIHARPGSLWSPDQKRLALIRGNQTITLWNVTPPSEAKLVPTGKISSAVISPDGGRIAALGQNITVWDAKTSELVQTLPWPTGWQVMAACWSPDGKQIASSSLQQFSGTIKVWDVERATELAVWNSHIGPAMAIAWSPDGKCLATCGVDKLVKIWDASAKDKELHKFQGHTSQVNAVAWNPKGHWLASAGNEGVIKLWDPAGVKEPTTLRGHAGPVRSLVWEPNGERLVSAGADGIKVWALSSGKELLTLRGHSGPVRAVAWRWDKNPQLQRLASISDDGALKIWDPLSGQEVMSIAGNSTPAQASGAAPRGIPFLTVAWAPDGNQLIAATFVGFKIWDASDFAP